MVCIHRCFKKRIRLTIFGLILSSLSAVSCLITIVYYSVQLSNLNQYDYVYEYQPGDCRPMSGLAKSVVCTDNGAETTNWIAYFTLNDGTHMVYDPFALRSTRKEAIDDWMNLKLNTSYLCVRRSIMSENLEIVSVRECSLWPAAIMNTGFINYIQRDGNRYYHTFISFIASSAVTVILCILALPLYVAFIKQFKQQDYVEF